MRAQFNPKLTLDDDNAAMTSQPTSSAAFAHTALSPALINALQTLGFQSMTPVQAASLPHSLSGRDVIAQAKTGSGKTAAYALALLHKLDATRLDVQAMVMCPTRELADQVCQEIRRLARTLPNVKVITLCGGSPMRPQIESLAHGAHVVVGTPGRLLDHLERETLNLSKIETLVLDEADRMLDMGFVDDIAKVASLCPRSRQTLLFSATYPEGIAKLAQRFMRDPAEVTVQSTHHADKIVQHWFEVDNNTRLDAVRQLLLHYRPASALAFCNTKQQCRDLVAVLLAHGVSAMALHGDLEQRDRDQVLIQFANRSVSVLVATDVAARGLDITQLEAVINVDVATDPEVHIHRIGRTGRADAQGLALNLASLHEMGQVGRIELLQGQESQWQALATLVASDEPLQPPMETLQILGGRKDKIRPGDVLGALTGEAGYAGDQIGKINVTDFHTYVAIERGLGPQAVTRLNNGKVKGRKIKARLMSAYDASTS
jgi:ATP-dependent RNA helicase DbpA